MMDLLHQLLDLIRDPSRFADIGYWALALVVFLETGAMVFFLPGDSLLVTAGVYAATGKLSLLTLNLILIPAAVLGPVLSYWIGATAGPMLFNRPRSRFFRPEHVVLAQQFYEKHGGKALVIARFMPIMRTFVPIVAGIGRMSYPRYAYYTVIGAASWVLSMTLLGYFVGQTPLGKHIEVVIIAVVLFSITPGIVAWLRARKSGASVANGGQG